MNTRQAIQSSDQPVVICTSVNPARTRFIAGLSQGCRLFRTDNCLTTYQPQDGSDGGVGVVAVLDDRYSAFVKGGRMPKGSPHVFIFWDAVLGKSTAELDFHEPIVGIRLSSEHAAVILLERTILLDYQRLSDDLIAPNKVKVLHKTAANCYGLNCLHKDMLVLPAQAVGQVQLIPLPAGSKRVFKAHNGHLRAIALSDDAKLIATCSVQGTLIRVFDTITLDQIAEFRRGVDHAIIYSLAISPGKRWLACTSDKGTLHIFDMRPDDARPLPVHRRSGSHTARIPSGSTQSSPPASVQYQGSVQEYYGLLPPPSSASPTGQAAAISALSAFKNSSLAPKVLKDVRSIVSGRFSLSGESSHWQGGTSHSWTVAPDGTRRRVRNVITPLAADPSGKAPKGLLVFAPDRIDDDDGAIMYVIGGGTDARWERFELAKNDAVKQGSPWVLSHMGYRRYLTRQFVD